MSDDRAYIDNLRKGFPNKSAPEIELLCSASTRLQRMTGISAHEHRKRGMESLFPERVWHDWRDQRIASVQECLEKRIQELMWIGASNSNKSADMADIALTLWWTKPEQTSIYVTSPYEQSTELGVWAYIQEQFEAARKINKNLPGQMRYAQSAIVLYDRNPRSFIRVASVDQIGKLVGKKSLTFGDGLLVFIADELPAFSAVAARNFVRVMANLWSVPNMLVIGAGNFAATYDALGIFCDPDERDVPGGYDRFDPDKHFRWRTKRRGLALRFDGLKSPNVVAGEDKYPFLTTIDYIGKLAAMPGGLQSADAMRFVRSAPVTSFDEMCVTNSERIRAGGCFDPYEWTKDDIIHLAFCDPGFGGHDPCVIQKFKLGWTRLSDGGKRQTLALWEGPHFIPIYVSQKDADGVPIPVEDQIALGMKAHCEEKRLRPEHVAYDGSLRAGLGNKVATLYSPRVVPIDSTGNPSDRPRDATGKKKWNEVVDRLVSEYWFAAASLIDTFQLRGLELSLKAVEHLTTRQWEWRGKNKKGIQTKKEYREMLIAQGKKPDSPNEGDTVCGGIEMARRLGLQLNAVRGLGGSADVILEMIRERGRTKLRSSTQGRTELPSGRLHAMQRVTPAGSGRLNR